MRKFRKVVYGAFDQVFDHLGDEVIFSHSGEDKKTCLAIIKEPELPYEIGDSPIVNQISEVALRSGDVKPVIGDFIIRGENKYKIYDAPVLDASTYLWRFHAILVEKENE